MAKAYIHHYLNWQDSKIFRDGKLFLEADEALSCPDLLPVFYQKTGISYPKFFKMDLASRLGFLASCALMKDVPIENPAKTGIICSSYHGSLEVDKAFEQSRKDIPSPALFVYTLPNIPLGEICIFHKIKGPQICLIEENLNPGLLATTTKNFLDRNRAEAFIVGHIDAVQDYLCAQLVWINNRPHSSSDIELNAQTFENLFR